VLLKLSNGWVIIGVAVRDETEGLEKLAKGLAAEDHTQNRSIARGPVRSLGSVKVMTCYRVSNS
jgi:hypothetical protein